MAEIIIKKKVSLEFLGEEYKDAYLTFRAISLDEIEKLDKIVNNIEDTNKAIDNFKKICREYFIDGKFPDSKGELQNVTLEDLGKFNTEVISACFEKIVGILDPKDKASSTNSSGTVA